MASRTPRAIWMPRTTEVGVMRAIQPMTPVRASSSQMMPVPKAEALTKEGDQAWEMATTANTFIGSMGMGSR